MGALFIQHFDDVEAILRFHQVRNIALVQAKSGLFELRDGLPLNDPPNVATLGLGAGVFGVFLGQILEIGAFLLGLGEDVLGLLPDLIHFGVGLSYRVQQDV